MWVLEIPEDHIICRVDDFVWNKIIGQPCGQPPQCRSRCENLSKSCNGLLRMREERQTPNAGGWWDELIVNDGSGGYFRSALIRHPVRDDWIKETNKWSVS